MSTGFDSVIHPLNRLQICALLAPIDEMEFSLVRDELQISDSVLSKQLRYLEEAEYVTLRKANQGGRQRTWLSLTKTGKTAFAGHVRALQEIAEQTDLLGN